MKRAIEPSVVLVTAVLLAGCGSESSGTISTTTTTVPTGSTTTTNLDLDASFPDGSDDGSVPCAPQDFPLSETQDLLIVPIDARFMQVKAWGAGGNGEGQCTLPQDDAGLGGFSGAVFAIGPESDKAVKPGDPLLVIVGQRGRAGLTTEDVVRFGFGHWGGGGLSGVFHGPDLITATDQAKALIVAGGGGGASAPGCMPAGTGNHPSAGGMGATMAGGPGADDVNGGAGGYVGGLGGAHQQPGKGGSGFVHDKATDGVMLFSEPGTAVPPKSDDVDYADGAGGDELPGRVVIHFTCSEPPPM
jgi:hypothetical protein